MISVEINNKQKLQLVDSNSEQGIDGFELQQIDSKGDLSSSVKMTHGEFAMLMNAFRNHKNGMDVRLKDYLA